MNCFVSDTDGHDYMIPVSRRECFYSLLEIAEDHDEYDDFNDEFESMRLEYDISQYCFDNTRLIGDTDAD